MTSAAALIGSVTTRRAAAITRRFISTPRNRQATELARVIKRSEADPSGWDGRIVRVKHGGRRAVHEHLDPPGRTIALEPDAMPLAIFQLWRCRSVVDPAAVLVVDQKDAVVIGIGDASQVDVVEAAWEIRSRR